MDERKLTDRLWDHGHVWQGMASRELMDEAITELDRLRAENADLRRALELASEDCDTEIQGSRSLEALVHDWVQQARKERKP